jgi:hypothetical protein
VRPCADVHKFISWSKKNKFISSSSTSVNIVYGIPYQNSFYDDSVTKKKELLHFVGTRLMIFPIALTTNSCDCAMSEPNTIHGLHQIRTTPNASLLAAKCTRTSTQIRGEFTSCDPGRPTAIPDRSLSGTVPSG